MPAVGFFGTGRGVGITFNSTLTALTLALLMMFLLHQLQHIQYRVVLDTKNLIDQRLIARLRLG